MSKPALVSRRAARRVPKSLRKQSSAVESRLLCCRSFVTDGDLGRLSPNRERGDNGREPRSGEAQTDRQRQTDRTHPSPSSPPPSSAARTCLLWRKFSGLCHSRIRGRGKVGEGKGGIGDSMIVISVQAAGVQEVRKQGAIQVFSSKSVVLSIQRGY